MQIDQDYDYVIIGSGFGGSVSALRLSEKGYKVLVIEKGAWFKDGSFAKNAWHFRRWLWMPRIGFRGIFKLTVLRHVTVYSGVGVGGGSLVYGATLPTPKQAFFESGSWAKLQNWKDVLAPHYKTAQKMLGATPNPNLRQADHVIKELATRLDKEDDFHPSTVGVFFSDKDQEGRFVDDPYFDGEGPPRKGCVECGGCMTGCRYNAKNSLDKNYLYLAQKRGAKVIAEHEVLDVKPAGSADGKAGYFIHCQSSRLFGSKEPKVFYAKGVIFSGGVLGSVPLLLKLKETGSLARLSDKVGADIRTNNETVTYVTSFDENVDFAQGVTIGSVLNTDEHSHLEPINQHRDSGFMKFLSAPWVEGDTLLARAISFCKLMVTSPKDNLKVLFSKNWAQKTIFLLFMQHLDSTLKLKRGFAGFTASTLGDGPAPSRTIAASNTLTKEVEKIVDGKAAAGITEVLLGTPSTAHVLGGAVMGANEHEGVVNDKCEVFAYQNMYVCDGSVMSANPGVNPSLSITAISEWAMSNIKPKAQKDADEGEVGT